jgi:hypothetical protein
VYFKDHVLAFRTFLKRLSKDNDRAALITILSSEYSRFFHIFAHDILQNYFDTVKSTMLKGFFTRNSEDAKINTDLYQLIGQVLVQGEDGDDARDVYYRYFIIESSNLDNLISRGDAVIQNLADRSSSALAVNRRNIPPAWVKMVEKSETTKVSSRVLDYSSDFNKLWLSIDKDFSVHESLYQAIKKMRQEINPLSITYMCKFLISDDSNFAHIFARDLLVSTLTNVHESNLEHDEEFAEICRGLIILIEEALVRKNQPNSDSSRVEFFKGCMRRMLTE